MDDSLKTVTPGGRQFCSIYWSQCRSHYGNRDLFLPPLSHPLPIYCSSASGYAHAHCMGNENCGADDLNFECRASSLDGRRISDVARWTGKRHILGQVESKEPHLVQISERTSCLPTPRKGTFVCSI